MYSSILFDSVNVEPIFGEMLKDFSENVSSIFLSTSLEISTPSEPTTLIPLYSGGLCDAVIIIPPSY